MKHIYRRLTLLTILAILFLLVSCSSPVSSMQESKSILAPHANSTERKLASTEAPKKEYKIPYDKMFSTPKSTCFSEIGYDAEAEILAVRFRSSGKAYLYLGFPSSEWDTFKTQKSLGGYYNSSIKGYYTSVKVEE